MLQPTRGPKKDKKELDEDEIAAIALRKEKDKQLAALREQAAKKGPLGNFSISSWRSSTG